MTVGYLRNTDKKRSSSLTTLHPQPQQHAYSRTIDTDIEEVTAEHYRLRT